MISVGIADDHRLFAEGLLAALRTQPDLDVRWTAGNGPDVEKHLQASIVDVLLLDWEMPDTQPALLIQRWATHTAIIVVTMHEAADDRARKAGAVATLPKSAPLGTLAAAIRAAASGLSGWTEADLEPFTMPRLARDLLTDRERELLGYLISGLTSTDDLARELYISKKTVKNHLANIYAKLGVNDRAQAVVEAQRLGIRPTQPDDG